MPYPHPAKGRFELALSDGARLVLQPSDQGHRLSIALLPQVKLDAGSFPTEDESFILEHFHVPCTLTEFIGMLQRIERSRAK